MLSVISGNENIHFTCGDASRLGYQSGRIDLVIESTMFIQLTDDDLARRIAAEMLRVVKPAGYLMLVDWRYSYGHAEYRALSRRRIAELFQVGRLTRIRSRTRGALVPPLGRVMSSRLSALYFLLSSLVPPLVGQVTTVLERRPDGARA